MVDFNESKIAEFAKSNEPILDEPITLEEIRKASTKLKTGKAAGIFPQLWSVGCISPVLKAGNIGDPNNAPINVKPGGGAGGGRAWGGD